MKDFFSEFFQLSKRERNATLILILLLVSIISARISMPYWSQFTNQPDDFSEFDALLAKMEEKQKILALEKEKEDELNLYPFNPNKVSGEELKEMGFKSNVVNSLVNFRKKSDTYKNAEDLLKLYGIDSALLAEIEPFLVFDSVETTSDKKSNYYASRSNPKSFENKLKLKISQVLFINKVASEELVGIGFPKSKADQIVGFRSRIGGYKSDEDLLKCYAVDSNIFSQLAPFLSYEEEEKTLAIIGINSCNEVDLRQFKGIGDFRAKKIISYREALGGYVDKSQLYEISIIPTEVIDELLPFLEIDREQVQKIDLNTVEFKELLKHPYFDYDLTKEIFRLKNRNGKISSVEELKTIIFVGDSKIRQIEPYLTFQN